jgi:hypothetical protein
MSNRNTILFATTKNEVMAFTILPKEKTKRVGVVAIV